MGTSLQVTDLLGRQRIAHGRPGVLAGRRSNKRGPAGGVSRDQSARARQLVGTLRCVATSMAKRASRGAVTTGPLRRAA
jgi:hypothetical protein